MRKISRQIVKEAKDYVYHILDHQLPEHLVFHDKAHTVDVLKNVELIGAAHNFSERDMNTLRICALFHDIGYSKTYHGHEKESARIAEEFLTEREIEKQIIRQVTTAIMATKVPQNPKDNFSKILCDADLMHLTYANYFEQIDYMRQEWALAGIASFSEKEFHLNSINFFNTHQFHSEYGQEVLEVKKAFNKARIRQKIAEL